MEKITVVCIDDQRDVLASVSRDLRPLGDWITVEECESADEAMEVLKELEDCDRALGLIVCDHIMPGTLGVDFLTKIEKSDSFKNVRKILITGQATHQDAIDAINFAKIDSYIEKPWDGEKFRSVCRRLLTEYIFASGKNVLEYAKYVDPEVMMKHMRTGMAD